MNWFGLVLMSLSTGCTVLTAWFSFQLRRRLHGSSVRSLTELQLELSDLQSAFASVHDSHKKLVQRISMRELRAARKSNDGQQLDGEAANTDFGVPDSREGKLRAIRERARAQGLL